MGYLHDVDLSVTLPASAGQRAGGAFHSWTVSRELNGVWELVKGFAAETFQLMIPVDLPASSGSKRAVQLASIDLWYEIKTADLSSVPVAAIERVTLPEDGQAWPAATHPAVTLEGIDLEVVGTPRLRISVDEPFWLGAGELCRVVVTFEAPAATAFYYYGARINFKLRE
jgi:hypothetical protein